MIDEFGLDFEVEKHILYLLRNAEKDQVLVLSEMVLNDTVPNVYHNSTVVPLSTAFAALLEAAQSQLHVLDTTHMCTAVSPRYRYFFGRSWRTKSACSGTA